VIRQILQEDGKALPKQRHTARRIFERLRDEHGYTGGETVVKDAVREWRISRREVFPPISDPPGEAARSAKGGRLPADARPSADVRHVHALPKIHISLPNQAHYPALHCVASSSENPFQAPHGARGLSHKTWITIWGWGVGS
jgi:hypothetical protein